MAATETNLSGRLSPIIDEVARAVGRHGLKRGDGGAAGLSIAIESNVKRVVQVYWTAFQAEVPGECVALNLEVATPRVHWGEAYLSPTETNWVFCFRERPNDGEIELAYYRDYPTPSEAIEGFFNLSGWYVLTATDHTWSDVTYELGDGIDWTDRQLAMTGSSDVAAVQESLKKSTILWIRWQVNGAEQTMPVWFVYDAKVEKIYVLSGEREQTLPGIERVKECDLILRWKGKQARVAELPAAVRIIPPGEEWDTIAEKVAEKRLNIPGLPEDTARRWRDETTLLELTLRS